jgi:putative ABC transport system permease protein
VRGAALATLVRRDLVRTRGALVTSGFGIAAGTAALAFFLALGLGVRAVLLGDVFPVGQVELAPPKGEDPGLAGLLFKAEHPAIAPERVDELRALPGVKGVYPKLRFAFPASARGGRDVLGRDIGTSELLGDGLEASLVADELPAGVSFDDPLARATKTCANDEACGAEQYCDKPGGQAEGKCCDPVPGLVSRYLVELFDKTIAPAHKLPAIGNTLIARAERVVFTVRLGESLLGKAKGAEPRTIKARLVGVSRRAVDLGVTLPIDVVRRLNREFAGEEAARQYSSVIVEVSDGTKMAGVVSRAEVWKLTPKDTRARDVSVLLTGIMAILSLVAGVILIVSASNIAHTFRVLVDERRGELALYRALGATRGDMASWIYALAVLVGVLGGGAGVLVARLAALFVDRLAKTHIPDFPFKPETFFAFPAWLWGSALGFAALFAIVGAVGPARRAARVDPLVVLAER